MAEYNLNQATTTDLKNVVDDYEVDPMHLDSTQETKGETYYDFPNSSEYLGYYKTIPELKKAIDALAIWTVGKGFKAAIPDFVILNNIRGWGEDTIQSILENLLIQKKVFGDAFAEIIRNDKGTLINLKPLYPGDMRVVVNAKGIITRYEQRTKTGKGKPVIFKPEQILHLCNDRIGNEIHGVSVIEACKWVIDARNEALTDDRKIKHRDLALGIAYYDTDNNGKITYANQQIENAIKNGEMLGLPKDTVEIKEFPTKSTGDRLQWIQYLENFFYQAVGIPKVIASSQDFTEAASKVGYLTFEPIYTREQTLLEADLWIQLSVRVKFNRPPSLHGVLAEDEQKNTGQTGMQQNEVQAQAGRVE